MLRQRRRKRRPRVRCRIRPKTSLKPSRLSSNSLAAADEALKRALRFLAPRARSEAEITEHLTSKGYSVALSLQILAKLRAWRYAGDESFARDWAHSRADARGYGPIKIEHELRAKGIDDAVIVGTLRETFAGNREIHNAREILRKRFGSEKLADPKTSRRAAAFLQRRGYSETVIQDILRPQED